MRKSSVYLLVGLILIFASENYASRTTEEIDFALEYFQNYNGIQCAVLNETQATER